LLLLQLFHNFNPSFRFVENKAPEVAVDEDTEHTGNGNSEPEDNRVVLALKYVCDENELLLACGIAENEHLGEDGDCTDAAD